MISILAARKGQKLINKLKEKQLFEEDEDFAGDEDDTCLIRYMLSLYLGVSKDRRSLSPASNHSSKIHSPGSLVFRWSRQRAEQNYRS